jgi:hypothetical protein
MHSRPCSKYPVAYPSIHGTTQEALACERPPDPAVQPTLYYQKAVCHACLSQPKEAINDFATALDLGIGKDAPLSSHCDSISYNVRDMGLCGSHEQKAQVALPH